MDSIDSVYFGNKFISGHGVYKVIITHSIFLIFDKVVMWYIIIFMTPYKHSSAFPVFPLAFMVVCEVLAGILSALVITLAAGEVLEIFLDICFVFWVFILAGLASIKDAKLKQKVMKSSVRRLVTSSLVGLIPFLSLVPWRSIAMYQVWRDMNK